MMMMMIIIIIILITNFDEMVERTLDQLRQFRRERLYERMTTVQYLKVECPELSKMYAACRNLGG